MFFCLNVVIWKNTFYFDVCKFSDTIRSIMQTVLSSNSHDSTKPSVNENNPNENVLKNAAVEHLPVDNEKLESKNSFLWSIPSKPANNSLWWYIINHCNFCDTDPFVGGCWFGMSTVCGYVRAFYFIYPTSCVRHKNKSVPKISNDNTSLHVDNGSIPFNDLTLEVGTSDGHSAAKVNAKKPADSILLSSNHLQDNISSPGTAPKGDVKASKDNHAEADSFTNGSHFEVESEDKVKSEKTVKGGLHNGIDLKVVAEAEELKVLGEKIKEFDVKNGVINRKHLEILANVLSESSDDAEVDNLYQGADDENEPKVQKLHSIKKETIFMKLKNRIKAMELNLNLSSRYLEKF